MSLNTIKSLKILTIVENMVGRKVWGSWGLSMLLEFEDAKNVKRKVLFDTGGDKKVFLHNIEALEVDITDINSIVVSHGHWDHTAALVEVVQSSGGIKVFCHPDTFLPRLVVNKEGKKREIGVPKEQQMDKIEAVGGEIIFNKEPTEICPGLWTTGEVKRVSFEKPMELAEGTKLIKMKDDIEIEDKILDDQSLWMNVNNFGSLILTGCAHAGLLNITNQIKELGKFDKLMGLIGGTHLVGRKDDYITETINGLKSLDMILLSPCHCTGFKVTAQLWQYFPKEFYLNYCGRKFEFQMDNLPEEKIF